MIYAMLEKDKERVKVVGFWGLAFNGGNMGCNALSYSFLSILEEVISQNILLYAFHQGADFDTSFLSTRKTTVVSVAYNLRSVASMKRLVGYIKQCDVSFDFTAGDSFSDIYGLKGFVKSCLIKELVMAFSKKFVLGPQTYGPYRHRVSRFFAKDIIKKADYVCSRDAMSAGYVRTLCGMDIDVYTDVAFALPYQNKHIIQSAKQKIGVNVSGLLWNGGYTGENQFGLKVDYRTYIAELIERLLVQGDVEVYVIPHVISLGMSVECDYSISERLVRQYQGLHLAPKFKTPIEAKSFISEMDVFIGARMHATIGAFSAGVATIPFSYSRKFEGLYENLGYPYVINARDLDTQTAIDYTMAYINQKEELKKCQEEALSVVQRKVMEFEVKVRELLGE